MHENKNEIIKLLQKLNSGYINEFEHNILKDWASLNADNKEVFDRITNGKVIDDLKDLSKIDINVASTKEYVLHHSIPKVENQRLIKFRKYIPYVAALLILCALGIMFNKYLLLPSDTNEFVKLEDIINNESPSYISLSSGHKIELKSNVDALITGVDRLQYADGSILHANESIAKYEMLELNTGYGGNYKVILSDGTTVWLNTNSKLIYPNNFSEDKRVVKLVGEAYFDVAKSDIPFIVESLNQQVEVLGTEFNISSYEEDGVISTTLIEGSVKVVNMLSKNVKIIKPGEQSILEGDKLLIQNKNVDDALAWKSGKFSFEDKSFVQVMNELARWYNLKIIYEGEIPKITFFGDAYRGNNLGIVLGALQSADIQYTMKENRTLIITGKKGGGKNL